MYFMIALKKNKNIRIVILVTIIILAFISKINAHLSEEKA